MKIHQLAKEEMTFYGVENLSLQNLLTIAIGTNNNKMVSDLSAMGIRKLSTMSKDELKEIEGVGETTAIKIQAFFGIAKQLHASRSEQRDVIRSPEDGAKVLNYLKYETQEHFVCLYLNTKNEVISKRTVFMGSLNASIVHPREVFKEAIRISAASIVCGHNHPSGDPKPSREDIEVTKRLCNSGRTLGIEILDHIIIGDGRFVSLKEKGYV